MTRNLEQKIDFRPDSQLLIIDDPYSRNSDGSSIELDLTDPVYKLVSDIMHSKAFERLGDILQMGPASIAHTSGPVGAQPDHCRYKHSIGVTLDTIIKLQALEKAGEFSGLSPEEFEFRRAAALVAALTHDLGHAGGSHFFERLVGFLTGRDSMDHEDFGRIILQFSPEIKEILENFCTNNKRPPQELLREIRLILEKPKDLDNNGYTLDRYHKIMREVVKWSWLRADATQFTSNDGAKLNLTSLPEPIDAFRPEDKNVLAEYTRIGEHEDGSPFLYVEIPTHGPERSKVTDAIGRYLETYAAVYENGGHSIPVRKLEYLMSFLLTKERLQDTAAHASMQKNPIIRLTQELRFLDGTIFETTCRTTTPIYEVNPGADKLEKEELYRHANELINIYCRLTDKELKAIFHVLKDDSDKFIANIARVLLGELNLNDIGCQGLDLNNPNADIQSMFSDDPEFKYPLSPNLLNENNTDKFKELMAQKGHVEGRDYYFDFCPRKGFSPWDLPPENTADEKLGKTYRAMVKDNATGRMYPYSQVCEASRHISGPKHYLFTHKTQAMRDAALILRDYEELLSKDSPVTCVQGTPIRNTDVMEMTALAIVQATHKVRGAA